jgi:hypothetical protein
MAKSVLITTANMRALEQEYDMEEGDLDGCVGYYLTADFGASAVTYGVLDEATLESNFVRTGATLKNGYFEVLAV